MRRPQLDGDIFGSDLRHATRIAARLRRIAHEGPLERRAEALDALGHVQQVVEVLNRWANAPRPSLD